MRLAEPLVIASLRFASLRLASPRFASFRLASPRFDSLRFARSAHIQPIYLTNIIPDSYDFLSTDTLEPLARESGASHSLPFGLDEKSTQPVTDALDFLDNLATKKKTFHQVSERS